jgi:cysteinyl-tRNA synthetase
MALEIYNTLSRSKEKFVPLVEGHVGIYVCGPTVYGDAHLGHAKSYISFDVIVRYLRFAGYKVRYVQNITDVGHMTDNDEDAGQDKIAAKAALERVEPMEIVTHFQLSYYDDMDALNIARPDIYCQASGHIPEQIDLIERLIKLGNAYESNGSVYYAVESFEEYGKLSGRRVEEMQSGARVEVNDEKKNPADFALWKRAEPQHIMRWQSPWGEGFPGWHVECSAMSMKYLGESFDIHGGGLENQFPHHESEIAQSEAATGKPYVNYWIHNNMLTIDGVKMGKSLGNFITVKDMIKKVSPQTLRLFVLMGHYRSVTDFSDEALGAAEKGMARLTNTIQSLDQRMATASDGPLSEQARDRIGELRDRFIAAMDDDFNMPEAVAELFNLSRLINSLIAEGDATKGTLEHARTVWTELAEDVLGLWFNTSEGGMEEQFDGVMQVLLDLRQKLRAEKQYAIADELRDQLLEAGIQIKDERDGSTWMRALGGGEE